MNAAYIHLLLTHVPIMATIFAAALLFAGLLKNQEILSKIALIGFITAGVFGGLVFLTGHGAEEAVEHLPGIAESSIEKHENAAILSLILVIILGVTSTGVLFLNRKKAEIASVHLYSIFFISILSGASFAYTANEGGEIRHPEIRSATEAMQINMQNGDNSRKKKKDDDD